MLSAESLLLIVVGAGLATGPPVAVRYLPAWYREWRAIKFLVPAAKHFRSRGGRDRPSVGAGFPLPKPAGEYRHDPYCGAPNMRAIKSLSMSTGSAASPLASRPWRKLTVIWALLFGLAHSAFAETILGRVVGVSDGDTITVLTRQHKQIKVRLASIDAPEMAHPFGQRSKESLSGLCF